MTQSADPILLVRRAFAWIEGHLDAFDPFAERRGYEIRNGQRVGELAILLKCYVGLTGDRDGPGVRRLLDLLRRVQANPIFADRLLRYPAELILFAQLYACLRALGFDEADKRAAIERALAANYLGQTERLPHRMMDVASCLDCGGFDTRFPGLPALYDASILTPVPFAAHLNEDAVYALTHVLMFLYDFGLRDTLAVPAGDRPALTHCLAALLVAACHEHHWDLLAELLVSWDCAGLPHGFIHRRAWQALEAVQRDDGAIPGPEWAQRQHDAATGMRTPESEHQFYVSHHYHTTLVGVIAGCLRAKREAAGAAIADDALLDDVSAAGAPPARDDADGLPLAEIGTALVAAGRWLERTLPAALIRRPARADELCRLLLGLFLCRSAGPAPAGDLGALVRTIGDRLAETGADAPDWSKTPPLLQLMAAALLDRFDAAVPHLHGDAGIVALTARGLAEASAEDDPGLGTARLLLHAMDRGAPSAPPARETVLVEVRRLPLTAGEAEIEDLLAALEALTAQGTRPVALGADAAWLGDLLAALATAMLRKYALGLACRILRAMRHLGLAHDQLAPCLAFLLMQQRRPGCFGLFGPEASALPVDAPVAMMLELPVTVECAWTLAEAGGSWRLFATLTGVGASAPARRPASLMDAALPP